MAAVDSSSSDDLYVTLTSETLKSSVKIHSFGAHVVSWNLDGKEQLYLSKLAKLDGSKAIRGGIPLVFPQFGPGKLKQHGFARDRYWEVIMVDNDCDCPFAVFRLKNSSETMAVWPNQFTLLYTVTLQRSSIRTQMVIENNNESDNFDFTALFHTYLRNQKSVGDVVISGLEGCNYRDLLAKPSAEEESSPGSGLFKSSGEKLSGIASEIDRTYADALAAKGAVITAVEGDHKFEICDTRGLRDIVVWNPWIEKAKKMSDFEDDSYPQMICIEAGTCLTPITIKPGQIITLSQTIRSSFTSRL